jgi:hypothetical protein
MRKAQVAEWILSLVTSRELAASTAGDWMEEIPARGTLWFWCCVFRTVGALVWRDISADPLHMTGLAVRAWLVSWKFFFLLCLLFAFVVGLPVLIVKMINPGQQIPDWIFAFAGWAITPAIHFQVGRWIARHAARKELAACVLFEVISMILGFITGGVFLLILLAKLPPEVVSANPFSNPFSNFSFYVDNLLGFASVIAGLLWVRRRTGAKVI